MHALLQPVLVPGETEFLHRYKYWRRRCDCCYRCHQRYNKYYRTTNRLPIAKCKTEIDNTLSGQSVDHDGNPIVAAAQPPANCIACLNACMKHDDITVGTSNSETRKRSD